MQITHTELSAVFRGKYGDPLTGPVTQRCQRFGYFFPDEFYEAAVDRLVAPGCRWLDVGGGRDVFPNNEMLARRLAGRCGWLTCVDPSPNVHENGLARERVQSRIEDYVSAEPYDLLTLRMVAEHIDRPDEAVAAMARLLKPGGRLVVYTVNKFAPVAVATRVVPFRLHHPLKRLVWRTEEKDTFPVAYRMNSRAALRRLTAGHGLAEESFAYLDDCRTFHRFGWMNYLELSAWRILRRVGASYPETCLLGVYRRD